MSIGAKTITQKPDHSGDSPDPIDVHVGKRLRDRRNLMGLSQEQLGNALGLTFQQIQKYERATNRIAASRLFELSRLLNVAVSYFYENMTATPLPNAGFSDAPQAPLEGAPKNDNEILQRRDVKELIRAYDRIADPKKRRIVYDLARSMAEE